MTEAARFRDRAVTIMGLGLFGGGAGAARFFCEQGARVTVTDLRSATDLRESIEGLRGLPIEYVLGKHRAEDFTGADLVLMNPAVALDSPFIQLARERGVPVTTEMNLFFQLCPGRLIGITGTNGKSTTTALLGHLLGRAGFPTHVGGNLGGSLLPTLPRIAAADLVVLELSSFQLQHLEAVGRSPEIAIVTNVSENHLDRHRDMEEYVESKRNILRFQGPDGFAILNADDPVVSAWTTRGARLLFTARGEVPEGAFVRDGRAVFRRAGRETPVLPVDEIPLLGRCNVENTLAALSAALLVGARPDALRAAVHGFRALEHRLERFEVRGGVEYYNDSISTNPASTLAALDAIARPVVLVLGGSSKGLPLEELAGAVQRRARGLVVYGAVREVLLQALERAAPKEGARAEIRSASSFEEAVDLAMALARPGDAVALSPAFASYDLFRNFEERGRRFKDLVRRRFAAGASGS